MWYSPWDALICLLNFLDSMPTYVSIFDAMQVLLGPDKVLMAGGCPLTRAALIKRGLDVVQANTTQSS